MERNGQYVVEDLHIHGGHSRRIGQLREMSSRDAIRGVWVCKFTLRLEKPCSLRPDLLNMELSPVWQKLLRKAILSTMVANSHRQYPERAIRRVLRPRTLLPTCRSHTRSARLLDLHDTQFPCHLQVQA